MHAQLVRASGDDHDVLALAARQMQRQAIGQLRIVCAARAEREADRVIVVELILATATAARAVLRAAMRRLPNQLRQRARVSA